MERHCRVEEIRRRVEEAQRGERRDGAHKPGGEAGGAAGHGGDGEKALESVRDVIEVEKVKY